MDRSRRLVPPRHCGGILGQPSAWTRSPPGCCAKLTNASSKRYGAGALNDIVSEPVCGSLSEQAYLQIRHKILSGEFRLGAALSLRKLAGQLKMSFIPISEVVRRLECEGLVESRPRVGTRVRVPTPQDIRDCYIIREALETQAERLFCEKAGSAERKEIREMMERLEEMTSASETEPANTELQFSVQSAHVAFHMRIVECTRCRPLFDLLEKNQVLIFNWFFDLAAGQQLITGRHRALVEAMTPMRLRSPWAHTFGLVWMRFSPASESDLKALIPT